MPAAEILAEFQASVAQCESLIANAHKVGADGKPILPVRDQQQITIAGFLNMYIAWERFLEASIAEMMTGGATINGTQPVKYVSPIDVPHAHTLLIGVMRFFDYANHDNVRKIAKLYFKDGYPYEPHLGSIFSDLEDMRKMRNASAHISSTTQPGLEALASRIFGAPRPGITLYQLLTAVDPRSAVGNTVLVEYKNKLDAAAHLIANG